MMSREVGMIHCIVKPILTLPSAPTDSTDSQEQTRKYTESTKSPPLINDSNSPHPCGIHPIPSHPISIPTKRSQSNPFSNLPLLPVRLRAPNRLTRLLDRLEDLFVLQLRPRDHGGSLRFQADGVRLDAWVRGFGCQLCLVFVLF